MEKKPSSPQADAQISPAIRRSDEFSLLPDPKDDLVQSFATAVRFPDEQFNQTSAV